MKTNFKILLISLSLSACNSTENWVSSGNPQTEIDIINLAIPSIIPKTRPCTVIPIIGEKPEEYDKRLQTFYDEIDSIGQTIEVVTQLRTLDSFYIEVYKTWDLYKTIPYLLDSPKEVRRIDPSQINQQTDVKIIFIDSTRIDNRGSGDCHSLGQLTFSRVGFNKDSTKAAFRYFIANNAVAAYFNDSRTGILAVERIDGKWEIIHK